MHTSISPLKCDLCSINRFLHVNRTNSDLKNNMNILNFTNN